MNFTALIGNVVKEVDFKITPSGTQVARFTLAINSGYGDKKKTDYINCVAFGKTAEVLSKYTSKGSKLAVEGKIQSGSYDGKDGKKVYTFDVIVDKLHLLDNKKKETQAEVFEPLTDIDGIPF